MSPYSVLGQNDIEAITAQYGISAVDSFSVLSGGSENSNYLVEAQQKRYVLTICEQKSAESASNLACLLEHLTAHGFQSSQVLRTLTNEPIALWNGKPVMLKAFLEGQITADLSIQLLESIGAQIATLHTIAPPPYLPKVLDYGIEAFKGVHDYAGVSDFATWLDGIAHYIAPYLVQELPKALIHSDIFYSNIVCSADGKSACIMDFEEAAYYYRIFDLGMTLVGLCCNDGSLNFTKARGLLKGYSQKIVLSPLEASSLQAFTVYAAASMAFWRHRQFNHLNPDPEMFDHYVALSSIADSVRKIAAIDFLQLLNESIG